jgi:hypothetical protein
MVETCSDLIGFGGRRKIEVAGEKSSSWLIACAFVGRADASTVDGCRVEEGGELPSRCGKS